MSTQVEVVTALFDEAVSWATGESLTVSFPGVDFAPPEAGTWMEVISLIDDVADYALGVGEGEIARGTLRIGVCTKPSAGIINILSLANDAKDNWPKSQVITGTTARVESTPSIASPLIFDDRIGVYTSVRWRDTI